MNTAQKLILLGAIGVIALVIAVGALRPGSAAPAEPRQPGALIDKLAELAPRSPVRAADVNGLACWDADGNLRVAPGQTCLTRLPTERTALELCVESGVVLTVQVKGTAYGPQPGTRSELPCEAGGTTFDLYDENSLLRVSCGPVRDCRLSLVS